MPLQPPPPPAAGPSALERDMDLATVLAAPAYRAASEHPLKPQTGHSVLWAGVGGAAALYILYTRYVLLIV